MLETARGCISDPMDRLKQVIELTDTYQTEFKSTNLTKKGFYFSAIPRPTDGTERLTEEQSTALRPFVLISSDQPAGFTLQHQATFSPPLFSGSVNVSLEKNRSEFTFKDDEEGLRIWENLIGTLVFEIYRKGWESQLFDVQRIHTSFYGRNSDESRVGEGKYFGATMKVDWGVIDQ